MHPGLNLNNLKYFFDAVETESISESAKRNFITQSAVSQGIQKLEKSLSTPLLTHQRNCFKLTPAGQQVFVLTQQIFKIIKELKDVVEDHNNIPSGQVNIVCTQSIAMNLISVILQKINADYPKVSVQLKICKMETVCLMLKRGVMDLGIVVDSELTDSFKKHVIRKGYFQVYAKKGHTSEGVYVDHYDGLFVDQLCKSYRKRFGKELPLLQELDSWEVLARCADNGVGCCFLPDFLLSGNRFPSLHICDWIQPIPYKIVVIHPKEVNLTKAARVLIDVLKE